MTKYKVGVFSKGFLGADPELFLTKLGHVVGSEKVIKENKLVVEDGVQVELHPEPTYCRDLLLGNLASCIASLHGMTNGTLAKPSLSVTVDVSKRQYDSLSDKNKQFGCTPSYNVHSEDHPAMGVDPSKYLKRSAGGHMHFGVQGLPKKEQDIIRTPELIVPLFDILVANTCVLLDRDEGNVERRAHYGLAGEYRTPAYGLEYRTLSNFWLIAPPVASFVFGLARRAIGIANTDQADELKSLVNMDDIRRAINTNDFDLALANYLKYRDFLVGTGAPEDTRFVMSSKSDTDFFGRIVVDGLEKWFKKDIYANWLNSKNHYARGGWTRFKDVVRLEERNK